jgi:hypothetical protein
MIMKKWIALTAFCLAPITGAQAQGVFDLGALTNSIPINATKPVAAGAAAAPVSASALASMRYVPSMTVRKATYAEMVKNMRAANVDVGNQMEAVFAQTDVIGLIDDAMGKFGMSANNIADAYALYFLSAWMGANGRTDENTPEQLKGTQKMAQDALSQVPDMLKLADDKKQTFSESLLIQSLLNDEMIKAVASDPAGLSKVKNDIKMAAKEMGIDVDGFNMTANGLVRK